MPANLPEDSEDEIHKTFADKEGFSFKIIKMNETVEALSNYFFLLLKPTNLKWPQIKIFFPHVS